MQNVGKTATNCLWHIRLPNYPFMRVIKISQLIYTTSTFYYKGNSNWNKQMKSS